MARATRRYRQTRRPESIAERETTPRLGRQPRRERAHVGLHHRAYLAQCLVRMRSGLRSRIPGSSSVYSEVPGAPSVAHLCIDCARRRGAVHQASRHAQVALATCAGWSHSCVTPTSDSIAPSAATISVAEGSNETTRIILTAIGFVHHLAADPRGDDVRGEDRLERRAHDVLVEYVEVGVLAGRQRSDVVLLERGERGPDRHRLERLVARHALLGIPAARGPVVRVLTRHRGSERRSSGSRAPRESRCRWE